MVQARRRSRLITACVLKSAAHSEQRRKNTTATAAAAAAAAAAKQPKQKHVFNLAGDFQERSHFALAGYCAKLQERTPSRKSETGFSETALRLLTLEALLH